MKVDMNLAKEAAIEAGKVILKYYKADYGFRCHGHLR